MGATALSPDTFSRNLAGLEGAARWCVGFSGGVDSSVLLHLLLACREANPGLPPVSAIHVDHGLQSQSGQWRVHCEQRCADWGVPLLSRQVDATAFGSGEAGARAARFSVFEELLGEGDVLLLGHHLDDQVETFFLRLMRGAGVQGLAAIPARRALGGAELARPLLGPAQGFTRAGIERYARDHSLDYIHDPSNADTGFDRNFLRAEVLPLLATRWPGYREAVTRAAGHMAATDALLRDALGTPREVSSALGDPGLSLEDLFARGAEGAALVLRNWLACRGLSPPDRAPLREFLQQLAAANPDARPRLRLSACVVERYRDAVYLLPPLPGALRPVELRTGAALELPGVGELALARVDADGFSLSPGETPRVRWREGGERLRLAGRRHSTSLKQLLQEQGVPPWWRDAVPLLAVGDEILCVGDLARCESRRWREAPRPGETLWRFCWRRGSDAPPGES